MIYLDPKGLRLPSFPLLFLPGEARDKREVFFGWGGKGRRCSQNGKEGGMWSEGKKGVWYRCCKSCRFPGHHLLICCWTWGGGGEGEGRRGEKKTRRYREEERGREGGRSTDEEGKRREISDVRQRSDLKRRGQIKQTGDEKRCRTQRWTRHHRRGIRDRRRGKQRRCDVSGRKIKKKENQQRPVIENRLKGSEGGEQGGINYWWNKCLTDWLNLALCCFQTTAAVGQTQSRRCVYSARLYVSEAGAENANTSF